MSLKSLLCLAGLLAVSSASYHNYCPSTFGYYALPDCSGFTQCVWGKPINFKCPLGTKWSQKMETCDHTWRVYCGNTYAPTTPYQHKDTYAGVQAVVAENAAAAAAAAAVAHVQPDSYVNTYQPAEKSHYGGVENTHYVAANNYDAATPNAGHYPVNSGYQPTYGAAYKAPYAGNFQANYKGLNYQPAGYQPDSNMFHAGYGPQKVYYKK